VIVQLLFQLKKKLKILIIIIKDNIKLKIFFKYKSIDDNIVSNIKKIFFKVFQRGY
jgi:hypothetical protein